MSCGDCNHNNLKRATKYMDYMTLNDFRINTYLITSIGVKQCTNNERSNFIVKFFYGFIIRLYCKDLVKLSKFLSSCFFTFCVWLKISSTFLAITFALQFPLMALQYKLDWRFYGERTFDYHVDWSIYQRQYLVLPLPIIAINSAYTRRSLRSIFILLRLE